VAREWSAPLRAVVEIHLEPGICALRAVQLEHARHRLRMSFFVYDGVWLRHGTGRRGGAVHGASARHPPKHPRAGASCQAWFWGWFTFFPHRNIGLEMASVLMIFTGQVWNMTFSFYSSLKSVPRIWSRSPVSRRCPGGNGSSPRPFVLCDRPGLEQHDVDGRRLVFSHGERSVCVGPA